MEGAPGLRGRAGRGLTFSHQQDPHVFLHVGGSQGPHSARTHGAHASRRERPARGAAFPALPPLPASLSGLCARISAARTCRNNSSATAPLRSRVKAAPPPPAPRTRAAAARTTACGEGHALSECQRSRVWNSAPAGRLTVAQNPEGSPEALSNLARRCKVADSLASAHLFYRARTKEFPNSDVILNKVFYFPEPIPSSVAWPVIAIPSS